MGITIVQEIEIIIISKSDIYNFIYSCIFIYWFIILMKSFFNSYEFIYILLFFSDNDNADESFLDDTFLIDEDDFALLDDLLDGCIDNESFVSSTDTITSADTITSSVTSNSNYYHNNPNYDNHNHDHDVDINNNSTSLLINNIEEASFSAENLLTFDNYCDDHVSINTNGMICSRCRRVFQVNRAANLVWTPELVSIYIIT